jgi:hypothetical protein
MAAARRVSGMDSAARARDGAQRGNSPARQDGGFALIQTPGSYEFIKPSPLSTCATMAYPPGHQGKKEVARLG